MRRVLRIVAGVLCGLRFRLLLLVALVCAPLIGLTLQKAWSDRRHALTGFRQRAVRLTQMAEREEEAFIGQTRQLLLAIAESAPVRAGNRRGAGKLLGELFAAYPRYANFGVTKTNGELIASARFPAAPASPEDRALLERVVRTGEFAVADSQTRPAIGAATLGVACPVFGGGGDVIAVVFAALNLDWFDRFGGEVPNQVPKGATWTQLDRAGKIIVRYPHPDRWVGRPLPDETVLHSLMEGGSGMIEAPDRAGNPSVYAFDSTRSLVSGKTATLLAIPKDTLFAGANHALAQNVAWLGVAVSMALAIGWVGSTLLVLRPVSALVHSSARLASGDLTARTGLPHGRDELGRLTYSFDQMAQALQQREGDRRRAAQKLHLLSLRLVEVQEAERRHIARELHDEIGQSLTVAEMNIQAALETTGSSSVTQRLKDSAEAVERVLHQVQDLSLNLRPSLLDDLGLEPALRWYTHRQACLAGLEAELRADPLDRRLDPQIETACFRIAQEALTNVVRHARARQVSVQLSQGQQQLHLYVSDDGQGFEVATRRKEATAGESLGLISMAERAEMAGGGLDLVSQPGQGTQIHAWFPLRWKLEASDHVS